VLPLIEVDCLNQFLSTSTQEVANWGWYYLSETVGRWVGGASQPRHRGWRVGTLLNSSMGVVDY